MDHARFDLLTKALGAPSSRRAVTAALAALVAGRAALPAAAASCPKQCKKKHGKCCGKCFKTIDPHTGDIEDYLCCPSKNFCKGVSSDKPDQCCYNDEKCVNDDPTLLAHTEGNGVCCRTCSDPTYDGCCPTAFFCDNGTCTPIGTARLPRSRR